MISASPLKCGRHGHFYTVLLQRAHDTDTFPSNDRATDTLFESLAVASPQKYMLSSSTSSTMGTAKSVSSGWTTLALHVGWNHMKLSSAGQIPPPCLGRLNCWLNANKSSSVMPANFQSILLLSL
mmetsp:Transcript_75503/g.125898  ORF Transcript_75503/g.125898 Transcript_75503/m.125898 type:complete len:125 (-) Transcript_75503:787-1161(-)